MGFEDMGFEGHSHTEQQQKSAPKVVPKARIPMKISGNGTPRFDGSDPAGSGAARYSNKQKNEKKTRPLSHEPDQAGCG